METISKKPELIGNFIELISFLDKHKNEPIEFTILEGELQLVEPSDVYSEDFIDLIDNHSKKTGEKFITLLDYYCLQLLYKGFNVTEELTNNGALIKIFR